MLQNDAFSFNEENRRILTFGRDIFVDRHAGLDVTDRRAFGVLRFILVTNFCMRVVWNAFLFDRQSEWQHSFLRKRIWGAMVCVCFDLFGHKTCWIVLLGTFSNKVSWMIFYRYVLWRMSVTQIKLMDETVEERLLNTQIALNAQTFNEKGYDGGTK